MGYRYQCGGDFHLLELNCVKSPPTAASSSLYARAAEPSRAQEKEKSKGATARLDRNALGLFSFPALRRFVYLLFEPLRKEAGQSGAVRSADCRPLSERARPLRLQSKARE